MQGENRFIKLLLFSTTEGEHSVYGKDNVEISPISYQAHCAGQ